MDQQLTFADSEFSNKGNPPPFLAGFKGHSQLTGGLAPSRVRPCRAHKKTRQYKMAGPDNINWQ